MHTTPGMHATPGFSYSFPFFMIFSRVVIIGDHSQNCLCGMMERDFPDDLSQCPEHWQCLKCSMLNEQKWVMIESNIASTEIRKRIRDVTAQFDSSSDQLSKCSDKEQHKLMVRNKFVDLIILSMQYV